MKWTIAVVALILFLVLPVGAQTGLSLTFQESSDYADHISTDIRFTGSGFYVKGYVYYIQATNVGNSYMDSQGTRNTDGEPYAYIRNNESFAMTYSAASWLSGNKPTRVQLYDISGSSLGVFDIPITTFPSRIEIKAVGSTFHAYHDGVEVGTPITPATNPYRIGYSQYTNSNGVFDCMFDDMIWGEENHYIIGIPRSNFFIKKDIFNPSNSGLAYISNGTVVSTTNLPFTWAKDNGNNETIQLVNYMTGVVYGTIYTGTAYSGSGNFDIQNSLINSDAPGGFYAITIPGSGYYSSLMIFQALGANVAFDRDTYSTEDMANIDYSFVGGSYWNTTAYTYQVAVFDVFGHFTNTSIFTSSGSVQHQFLSTDTPGVWYAAIIATPKTSGNEIWMGYDTATLAAVVSFIGKVYDAQTELVISGANVSFVQGTTAVNTLSASDGNYTASPFYTGSSITVNATMSGYQQHLYTFTPYMEKTVNLTIALLPITPSTSGLGIGGLDLDTTYGNPIPGALVELRNSTNGDYCYKITNSVGFYLSDESTCVLITHQLYDVWSSKASYANSTIYQVIAP